MFNESNCYLLYCSVCVRDKCEAKSASVFCRIFFFAIFSRLCVVKSQQQSDEEFSRGENSESTVRFAFSEVAPSPNCSSLNASVSSVFFLYHCRSVTLERVR